MAVNDESPNRLSRTRIIDSAVGLADAGGLDAVSMRNIGGALGVTAMSLYNHVANKDEILDGMLDAVFAQIDLPEISDWKAAIRASAISARQTLMSHPWATSLWMARRGGGPSQLRYGDWLLGMLRKGRLSDEVVFHAYHILESLLIGSTLQQLNFPYQGEELADLAQAYLRSFPVDEYPDMVDHIHQHLDSSAVRRPGFEFALDLILDGLDRVDS
ncbi:MAG: TetR/AcrR family transcriptional regulator [Acidimicrobiia bacterium]